MIAIVLAWGIVFPRHKQLLRWSQTLTIQTTFQYTEGGETKTAKLTDEATTPDHIIALLKAVYTDKTIPGIHYGYNYNGTTDNLSIELSQQCQSRYPLDLGHCRCN